MDVRRLGLFRPESAPGFLAGAPQEIFGLRFHLIVSGNVLLAGRAFDDEFIATSSGCASDGLKGPRNSEIGAGPAGAGGRSEPFRSRFVYNGTPRCALSKEGPMTDSARR